MRWEKAQSLVALDILDLVLVGALAENEIDQWPGRKVETCKHGFVTDTMSQEYLKVPERRIWKEKQSRWRRSG